MFQIVQYEMLYIVEKFPSIIWFSPSLQSISYS